MSFVVVVDTEAGRFIFATIRYLGGVGICIGRFGYLEVEPICIYFNNLLLCYSN